MTVHDEIRPIANILLATIAREANTMQEHLSLETEQVVMNVLIAAYNTGYEAAHKRPTAQHPPDPNLIHKSKKPRGTFKP